MKPSLKKTEKISEAEVLPLADEPQSLMEHLDELRNRLLICIGLIIICTAISYSFVGRIMELITASIGKLYFMSPTEAFWVKLKVAMFSGFYFSLPFLFYQVWRFVEVGLRQKEKRLLLPLSLASFILFSGGAAFCYFLVIPVAVKFLLSYGSASLVPLISVSKYLSFVGCLVFAFGVTFQLPLVMMVLARVGLINNKMLRKFRRFAILGSFILGAALTPTPDMVNQTLMALPIIVLYEISIWLVKIFEQKPAGDAVEK